MNGQASLNDLAKADVSDGIGPHTHGDFGPHQHGNPKFSNQEVEFLQGIGLHVDRFHGRVSDATGFGLAPPTVASMLRTAREEGVLKARPTEMMAKVSSQVAAGGGSAPRQGTGPVSGSPAVQHLDLCGGWSAPPLSGGTTTVSP
jgi:hypothetical protein